MRHAPGDPERRRDRRRGEEERQQRRAGAESEQEDHESDGHREEQLADAEIAGEDGRQVVLDRGIAGHEHVRADQVPQRGGRSLGPGGAESRVDE